MHTEYTPVRDEIAKRAELIWSERNQPSGQDLEIWLEAERQLATQAQSESRSGSSIAAGTKNADERENTAHRLTEEMASESEVEFHIAPAVSDAESVKAALQTEERNIRSGGKRTKTKSKNSSVREERMD
jgi:hypothetical protein